LPLLKFQPSYFAYWPTRRRVATFMPDVQQLSDMSLTPLVISYVTCFVELVSRIRRQ